MATYQEILNSISGYSTPTNAQQYNLAQNAASAPNAISSFNLGNYSPNSLGNAGGSTFNSSVLGQNYGNGFSNGSNYSSLGGYTFGNNSLAGNVGSTNLLNSNSLSLGGKGIGDFNLGDSLSKFGNSFKSNLSTIQGAVGVGTGIADIISKFGALGVAKDNLKFQKNAFNKNYNATKKTANNRINARYAERLNNYGKKETERLYGTVDSRRIK